MHDWGENERAGSHPPRQYAPIPHSPNSAYISATLPIVKHIGAGREKESSDGDQTYESNRGILLGMANHLRRQLVQESSKPIVLLKAMLSSCMTYP